MIEDLVKELSVEYLKNNEIGQNVLKAMDGVQRAQEAVIAYANDDSPESQKMMRAGTVLAFAIVSKVASGKGIKEFSSQDWEEIASKATEYGIMLDSQRYSEWVFSVYAKYVDISVKVLEVRGISKDKRDAISKIAENVRKLGKQLESGQLDEVSYTEQCLWLLLEAMVKLLSSYSAIVVGEELADLNQSTAMLAFEYARYALYRREQEILTQYLEHQDKVDEELEAKLSQFRQELQERCNIFSNLIDEAFSPDMSKRLRSSVEVARYLGVEESEILDSVEKVDDYFM